MKRLVRWILFGFIPFTLVLATLWSGWQLIQANTMRSTSMQLIEGRRDAYSATATALAAGQDSSGLAGQVQWVAQFATNTPVASGGGASGFGSTNTPIAPVNIATATPVPNDNNNAVPVATTPFAVPTFFPAQAAEVAQIAGTAVPTPVPLIPRDYELVNILLLGSDEELVTDNSVRTDTMIIVSINTQTRTVSMLSLPRDLFVYIPTPTMTRLNTVYGIGESFGWDGGGFGLLRQTIFYNFGINVHYYAKVNFSGFTQIIDTLGGVEIAVTCTYQDYYPVEDFDPSRPIEENYEMRTLPIGFYQMDGFDALWYARTRNLTTDFDRGRRQQQVLRAILRAARANGQIGNVPTLWEQLTQVVETNIPFDLMLGLLPIALDINPDTLETFVFIRTYHTTPWQPTEGPYAGQAVQLPNYEPIRDLLVDFYQPPTTSQIALGQSRIAVYNGTTNEAWDRVAVEHLVENGLLSYAAGNAERLDVTETQIIDYVGESKGSPVPDLLRALNANPSNVRVEPNPNRSVDYAVILGSNYNSCDAPVLGIEEQ